MRWAQGSAAASGRTAAQERRQPPSRPPPRRSLVAAGCMEECTGLRFEGVTAERRSRLGASGNSGGWCHAHVEGDCLGVAVVIAGVSLKSESDGGKAFALGVRPGWRSPAVDVEGRHAVMPVTGLLVEEQLDPQHAHVKIILYFRSSASVYP